MKRLGSRVLLGLSTILSLAGPIKAATFNSSEVGVRFNPKYAPVRATSLNDIFSNHTALHAGISSLGSFASCAALHEFGIPLKYAVPGGAILAFSIVSLKELYDQPGSWKDAGYNAAGAATGAVVYYGIHELGQLIKRNNSN